MMAATRRREQKPPTSRAGMEGRYEEGEREITGPQEIIAGERVGTQQRKYKVKVNVRASWLDSARARGRLDPTQYEAGLRFQKLWQLAAIGRSRGVNLEGGRSEGSVGDPFTDDLVQAGRVLQKLLNYFGTFRLKRFEVLSIIVGEEKWTIEEAARHYSNDSGRLQGRRAEGYITGTLFDAIDDLVRFWKMEAEGAPHATREHYFMHGKEYEVFSRIRASGPMSSTGPAREISIGKFGDTLIEEKRPSEQPRGQTSGNVGSKLRRGK